MTILQKVSQMNVRITYRRTSRISMRIGKNGDLLVSAPYLTPSSVIRRFIDGHSEWIRGAAARRAQLTEQEDLMFSSLPLGTAKEKAEAAAKLNGIIAPMIAKHAPEMGVTPGKTRYRASRTRWGSCNVATGDISFSLYLLLLPHQCIEHTVVHELAHLIVPNHGPAFRAVMDRFFPEWKAARKLARETMSR